MNLEEAYKLINTCGIKNSLGRYNSRALNEQWFIKNNLNDLWDFIHKETELFKGSIGERLWIFENLPIRFCVECGNVAKRYDNADHWSDFCSAKCAQSSPIRLKKSSLTKLNQDHTKINAKRKATMKEKYGVETNSQRPEVRKIISEKLSKSQLNRVAYDKLNDYDWLYNEYITLDKSASQIANDIGCDYTSILARARSYGWKIKQVYNKSLVENQITEFIEQFGFKVSSPTNKLSGKQEIDIYVEDLKIGIEIDGLYYHSYNKFETYEQKNRHLSKTLKAKENGIQLIHFTDYQWNNKQEIVKSMIKSKLGLNHKIYARNCSIVELSVKEAKEFLNSNHLQGYVGSQIRYGLEFNGNIVCCFTAGKPRYDKSFNWELLRFSSKNGITVTGGFSKLMKHFRDNNEGSIISYANRMHSNGNVYIKNGFTLVRETSPGYFWTDGNNEYSRTSFSKKLLSSKLKNFDPNKSEAENMFSNGYRRFWDCGNLVFSIG